MIILVVVEEIFSFQQAVLDMDLLWPSVRHPVQMVIQFIIHFQA